VPTRGSGALINYHGTFVAASFLRTAAHAFLGLSFVALPPLAFQLLLLAALLCDSLGRTASRGDVEHLLRAKGRRRTVSAAAHYRAGR
jgi:hypothetical protein